MKLDDIIKVTTNSEDNGIMTKLTLLRYIGINLTYMDGDNAGRHLGIGFTLFFLELEFVIRLWNQNAA